MAQRVIAVLGVGRRRALRRLRRPGRAPRRARGDHDRVVRPSAHRPRCSTSFTAAEAAIGPVMDMADIATDPHYLARDTITSVDGTPMQALIARLSATPGSLRWAGRAARRRRRSDPPFRLDPDLTPRKRCSCRAPLTRHRHRLGDRWPERSRYGHGRWRRRHPERGASDSRSVRWRPTDLDAVLAINEANVPEVGSISMERLEFLVAELRVLARRRRRRRGRRLLHRARRRLHLRLGELPLVHGSLHRCDVPRPCRLHGRVPRAGTRHRPVRRGARVRAQRARDEPLDARGQRRSPERAPRWPSTVRAGSSRSASSTRPTGSPCR